MKDRKNTSLSKYFINEHGEIEEKPSLNKQIRTRLSTIVNHQSRLITFLILSHLVVQGLCIYGLVDAIQQHSSNDQIIVLISISTLLGVILTATVLASWLFNKPKTDPKPVEVLRNQHS